MAKPKKTAPTPQVSPAEVRYEMRYLSVEDLIPNEWNPNVQTPEEFNRLCEEMSNRPCLTNLQVLPLERGQFLIIGGEHRWRAANVIGKKELPCMILQGKEWADRDLQKFTTMRLNIIHGKLDPTKFAKLYTEMATKYGADVVGEMMGYTNERAFQHVVQSLEKGLKGSLPKEMGPAISAAAKQATSVQDLAEIVRTLFNEYGDTVSHSFMVFSFGKQTHVYVQMTPEMRKSVRTLTNHCVRTKVDINTYLGPAILAATASITAESKKPAVVSVAAEPEF